MGILTRESLLGTHELVDRFRGEWELFLAAFEGTRALLELGMLKRHPRESEANHRRRMEEAIGFNYSRSVVEIFLQYLFEQPGLRELGELGGDAQFQAFMQDVDYGGTDYDQFWYECQQYASVMGHVGVLVAKPDSGAMTVAEERREGIYPYLTRYLPPAILDWRYRRNRHGRPELALVKVMDDDGTIRAWTPEAWEVWEPTRRGRYPELPTESGPNPLGRVPFVWHRNQRSRYRVLGISDIQDVARIDVSIMRNLSQADEVVDLAAFPMLMMPQLPAGEYDPDPSVGPSAVLEFDPQLPDSRPSWLRAEVLEPLEAILNLVSTKVTEIYRLTNTQGEIFTGGREVPSGRALTIMFRQLNAKLAGKADALDESEAACLRLWTAWQGRESWGRAARLRRPRDFSVRELAADLANLVTASGLVKSATFDDEVQKAIVQMVLPNLDDGTRGRIQQEIGAGTSR